MAFGMYETAFTKFFGGDVDFINNNISAFLIDTDHYTPDRSNDETVSNIPDASILSETALSGKFISGLQLHADALVFSSVTSSTLIGRAIVIFVDAELENDSHLLFIYDSSTAPEFPITPDGTDVTVNWSTAGLMEGTL